MLNKLNEWCSKWRLSINSDKTKIVHFRPASVVCCNDIFSCGHLNIEKTEKYKYFGLWFQEHLDLNFATSELAKSASLSCPFFMLNLNVQGVCLMMYILNCIPHW